MLGVFDGDRDLVAGVVVAAQVGDPIRPAAVVAGQPGDPVGEAGGVVRLVGQREWSIAQAAGVPVELAFRVEIPKSAGQLGQIGQDLLDADVLGFVGGNRLGGRDVGRHVVLCQAGQREGVGDDRRVRDVGPGLGDDRRVELDRLVLAGERPEIQPGRELLVADRRDDAGEDLGAVLVGDDDRVQRLDAFVGEVSLTEEGVVETRYELLVDDQGQGRRADLTVQAAADLQVVDLDLAGEILAVDGDRVGHYGFCSLYSVTI